MGGEASQMKPLLLADQYALKSRSRFRILLGVLISAVPASIAIDGFRAIGVQAEGEAQSAVIVGVLMLLVSTFCWYCCLRIHYVSRLLRRSVGLVGLTLLDADSRKQISLVECETYPLVKTKGQGLWPLSEAVIFRGGDVRILLAPSLLTDESQDLFREAWIAAGKEYQDFYADSLQSTPTPR